MYNKKMKKYGDSFPLIGKSKTKQRYALRTTYYYDYPIIISIGYKISNETAL